MAKVPARQLIGFNDLWFIVIGVIASGLSFPILTKGPGPIEVNQGFWIMTVVSAGFTLFYWLNGRWIVVSLRRKFPGLNNSFKRILIQVTGMLALIFAVNSLCEPVIHDLISQIIEREVPPDIGLQILLISIMMTVMVLGVYETVYMMMQWKATAIESEKLRRESVTAQLNSLKAQVNPHFLFNSLNTLTSIVHDDPDLSVEFIKKLSTTYRYLLEIRDQELITLEEELDCVQAYVFLLETRFGDSLSVELDVPESARKDHLVPLALQMLVENAIKHNVVSRRRPLKIEVFAEDQTLVVRNNLQPKLNPEPSTAMGLENIRSRYELVSEREVVINQNEVHFTVRIPLLEVGLHERVQLNQGGAG